MTKGVSQRLLQALQEIEAMGYVDMHYSQDHSEAKMNALAFPAMMLNVSSIRYEKQTTNTSSRIIEFSLLLLVKNDDGSAENEFMTHDLLDQIHAKVRALPHFTTKEVSRIDRDIERYSQYVAYQIFIEHVESV